MAPPANPKDANDPRASEDRRITRMHQMEMMEAAARGTAPSMQLDTTTLPGPGGTSGLRSRNTSHSSSEARRFLSGEEEDYQNSPMPSIVQIGPRGTSTGATTLFNERELYSVDQSVNLMDPAAETYTPLTSSKSRTSFVDIFLGGAGTTSGSGSTKGRGTVHTTWQHSVAGRLFVMLAFVGFGVFLAMSVSFLFQGPEDAGGSAGFVKTGNRYEDIKSYLLLNSASHTEYLTDQTTSAYHALRWLHKTDPAKLEAGDAQLLARFALACFYYSTHPDAAADHSSGKVKTIDSGWKQDANWMSENSVCEWYGVDCETVGSNDHYDVVHFNLTSNKVKGTIPLELKSLSNMVLLDLSNNQLSGTIPAPMLRMFQISYLRLNKNELTGTIPTNIGMMEGAYEIHLEDNGLNGNIPSSISKLSNLRALDLGNNVLGGSIPDLSGLVGLNYLNLQNNSLTSALPYSVAKLTNLYDLKLNLNRLTGTIPPELATNKNLKLLYLGNNQMSGIIPEIFDHMTQLVDVELHNNKFSKTLPTTFGFLTSLRRITVDENKLTGSLPSEWGAMTNLEALGMHHNRVIGPIPPEWSGMKKLLHLYLNHNFLEGELPSELVEMSKLRDLYLEHNAFKGTISTEFARLKDLETFRIFETRVTGTMPSGVCDLIEKEKLKNLEADCRVGKIKCPCCTQCY